MIDPLSLFCSFIRFCSCVAPEVIQKTGHGKAADWWALGAVIFEILVGKVSPGLGCLPVVFALGGVAGREVCCQCTSSSLCVWYCHL